MVLRPGVAALAAPMPQSGQPTISAVTPSSGSVLGGTSIRITGSNLAGASVTVGGVPAVVEASRSTSITARTRPGAAGVRDVVVVTPAGSATQTGGFTLVAVPAVTGVSPSMGSVAGGTTITIAGSNLAGATVRVGGVSANAVVATNTSITARTPSGSAGMADVTVTTVGGTASTGGAFTFVPRPVLSSVSPAAGPGAGGTTITISGSGLAGATVKVGGVSATNVVASDTLVTATTPAGSAGARKVEVTTVGGSASRSDAFTYVPAPTITSLRPPAGPLDGGNRLTIVGTNLLGPSVTIGGAPATIVESAQNFATVRVPPGSTGPRHVQVTTVGGSALRSNSYTYVPAPIISGLVPDAGPIAGGTTIAISGSNLAGAGVSIDGVPATVSATTDTSITAKVPAGAAGARDVVVTTAGGTSLRAGGFTYAARPAISAVHPPKGPTAGGTVLTISGTGLRGATVLVGRTAAVVTASSDTGVVAITPAGSPGARDVTVTTVGGTSVTAGAFTFTHVQAPSIWSVSPASGPASGGTTIVISGNRLTGALVKVGGSDAAVIASNSATVTAITPPGMAGACAVSVTTAGGTATLAEAFTYVASLTGDPGGMPSIGGRSRRDGPTASEVPGVLPPPVTMERCVALILQSGAVSPECAGTPCDDLPQVEFDPVVEGPDGPDLDGNGVPDLCQLRCGDLDLSGRVDLGDVSVLLTMIGEVPTLGLGDLDGDGAIGEADLAELLGRMTFQTG